ncbi:MAG: SdrD B-like domain-containing protein [Caldilineaceae bacterium]
MRQAAKFVEAALPQPAIALASGAISGTVFEDTNLNGSLTSGESGLGAVAVTVFDASGATCAASTSASGAYSINTATCGSLSAGPYRVEFALPTSLNYLEPSIAGGTTVQFVNDGGGTANVGFHDPADYCDNNPNLATSCYRNGSGSADVLYSWNYNNSGLISQGRPAPTREADNTQIGATWGLAYERSTGSLYAAAFLKRHSALIDNDNDSQGDLGAIYRLSVDGNSGNDNNPLWLDLDGAIDSNSNPIAVGTIANNSGRGIPASTTGPSADADAFFKVAKVGLGDIDINPSETMLWVVNVFQKTLHSVVVNPDGTPGTIDTYAIPTNQCNGSGATNDTQPFAVKYHNGGVYVGLVCSGEFTQSLSTMRAYVYRLPDDGVTTTFTEVLNFSLNYPRERVDVNGSCGSITTWRPWVTSFPSNCDSGSGTYVVPQPILSDIEFDSADGDMMVGFFDRWGHQSGPSNYDINGNNNVRRPVTGGEVLRATPNGNGAFTIESNIASGGEFYQDDFVDTGNGSGHFEFSVGGLAHLPGSSDLVLTVFDPIDGQGSQGIFVSGGVAFLSNTNGSKNNARGYQIYQLGSSPDTFGKAAGLGDLELLCDSAPLEIGNRVWQDADGDGIQDPGEAGINGVRVTLHNMDSGGAQVGAAQITSGDGGYLFTNLNPRTSYQVRVSLTDGSLPANSVVTQANQNGDSTNNNKSDLHDSDGDNGVLNAGFSTIAFTAGGPGGNNHTLDFGFAPDAAKGNIQVTKNIAAGSDAANVAHWAFTITSTTPGCDLPAPYDTNPALTTATGANGQTVTFVDLLVDDGGNPATNCQYSVEETNIPTGWQTTVATSNPQTALTVADGGTTQISFTNEELPATSIDLVKIVNTLLPATVGSPITFTIHITNTGDTPITSLPLTDTYDMGYLLYDSVLDQIGPNPASDPTDDGSITWDNVIDFDGDNQLLPDEGLALIVSFIAKAETTGAAVTECAGAGMSYNKASALGVDTCVEFPIAPPEPKLLLGDSIWHDIDNDGVQGANEPGLNGVLVNLYELDGGGTRIVNSLVSTTTATVLGVDGTYNFAVVSGKNYEVEVDAANFAPGGPLAGFVLGQNQPNITDGAADAQVSGVMTVNNLDLDFGYYCRFDLALDKKLAFGQPANIAPGDDVAFAITIYNQGVVTAADMQIADYIPAGFSLSASDNNGWSPTAGTALATVAGPIGPGESVVINIVLTAGALLADGVYTNTAEIADYVSSVTDTTGAKLPDADSAPNSTEGDGAGESTNLKDDVVNEDGRNGGDEDDHDPASITVSAASINPMLALNKTLNGVNPFGVGATISFTIRITNTGDVVITTLPLEDRYSSAFISYQSVAPALPALTAADGILTWSDLLANDPDGLGVNESISIDVYFNTLADTTQLSAMTNCSPAGHAPNLARVRNAFAGANPVDADGDDEDCASVQILNPTGVQLAERSLTQTPAGVLVRWQMVDETIVVGFHVWSSNGVESARRSELIMSKVNGQSSNAATYEWLDAGVTLRRGDVYVLEIVNNDGSTERTVIDVMRGGPLFLPLIAR